MKLYSRIEIDQRNNDPLSLEPVLVDTTGIEVSYDIALSQKLSKSTFERIRIGRESIPDVIKALAHFYVFGDLSCRYEHHPCSGIMELLRNAVDQMSGK